VKPEGKSRLKQIANQFFTREKGEHLLFSTTRDRHLSKIVNQEFTGRRDQFEEFLT
jgi:hypothetical protein